MTSVAEISSKSLKRYPHFDAPIAINEVRRIVTDPVRVATNPFYPFLLFHQKWQPYRSGDVIKPEKKIRPIRYGARRDAYIFSHYRHRLSEKYETRLRILGIAHCPLAYRQIRKKGGGGGKCNIDFAKDAFDEVDRIGNCVAVALDIKSYFESLDHSRIKRIWCDLLDVDLLPEDHYAVFRNITNYRSVEQREVLCRLGYLSPNKTTPARAGENEQLDPRIPTQLCLPKDFRAKICGGDPAYPSLIKKNPNSYGVPQGAPISDLIANFYLMEFDCVMNAFATQKGGRYMRYSDDILVIVPGKDSQAKSVVDFTVREINKHGPQLQIKESKTCVVQFQRNGNQLTCRHIRQREDERGKNGIEYLGFRYDGKRIYVRDSTISRFYRKVSSAARREGARHVANNPSLTLAELIETFNYSLFSQRFSRVKRASLTKEYRTWTFYSYLKRAAATFGSKGDRILRQARGFRNFMRMRVRRAIIRAGSHRGEKE